MIGGRDFAGDEPRPGHAGVEHARRFWDLPVAMLGIGDFDGWFVEVSAGYTSVLGWSAEELKSAPYWEFVHPADQHPIVESGEELLNESKGLRLGYEVRLLCRDGSYRWTRWNTVTVPREQLLYAVGMDVSELRPPVADRTVVGVWHWDIPIGRITWSPELLDVLDLPADATGFERFLESLHADDRTTVDRAFRWSLASGDTIDVDLRVARDDGQVVWMHAAGRVAMRSDGEPQRAAGIVCQRL